MLYRKRADGTSLRSGRDAARRAFDTTKSYLQYYGRSRTHLSRAKDAPEERAVQPPELGPVIGLAEVGGLHHRYERRAA